MRRILALILTLALLGGCKADAGPEKLYFMTMSTFAELTVYGEGGEQAKAAVLELEALLSVTDAESEISAINRDGKLDGASGHTLALLRRALELCELTGGALDISIYPVVRAWGFTTGEYRVPDEAELSALLERVDYRKISLDGSGITIPEGFQIDLGAIAKGYAGDLAADTLRQAGVGSALINLGGNVQALGTKPDGSSWNIAIKNPAAPEQNLGILRIADAAVVTSGGYERYFEEDGQIYWHIIDPETGHPAESGLRSVTVTGAEGAVCDALSTALFVMGETAALELMETLPDYAAVLVTEDGRIVTAGEPDFELL